MSLFDESWKKETEALDLEEDISGEALTDPYDVTFVDFSGDTYEYIRKYTTLLDPSNVENGIIDKLLVNSGTASTNTSTGALIVKGGVGIGSSVYIAGITSITNTTNAINKDTGALVVEGGVGIEKDLYVGGTFIGGSSISVGSTEDSFDKDTGALVIEGGVGIEKNLNVGGNVFVTGFSTFANGPVYVGFGTTAPDVNPIMDPLEGKETLVSINGGIRADGFFTESDYSNAFGRTPLGTLGNGYTIFELPSFASGVDSNWIKFSKLNTNDASLFGPTTGNLSCSWIGAYYNFNFSSDLLIYSAKKGSGFDAKENESVRTALFSQDNVTFYTGPTGNNNTEARFIINSLGNIGIGTNVINSRLSVNGTVTATTFSGSFSGSFADGSVTLPSITFTNDLNTGFWRPGEDILAASTGGIERFRIDALGNINIPGTVTSTSFIGNAINGSTLELLRGNMASNDQFRILIGGSNDAGYAEIATADNGNEPIYVRQYGGVFSSLTRSATLLDESGNTSFPGNLTVNGGTSFVNAIKTTTSKPLLNSSGSVINVYSVVDATQAFYQTLADINLTTLSITLTPTSTSSRFILVANITTTTNFVIGFGFKRSGTRIGKATTNINAGLAAGGTNFTQVYYEGSSNSQQSEKTVIDVDQPNTISSITYTPFFRNTWDGTNYSLYYNNRNNNDMGSTSSFIIYEVVG
jgi:hypothetical protein